MIFIMLTRSLYISLRALVKFQALLMSKHEIRVFNLKGEYIGYGVMFQICMSDGRDDRDYPLKMKGEGPETIGIPATSLIK